MYEELVETGMSPWLQFGLIILATFVSEDLTCLATGLLVRAGQIDPVTGLFACWIGILLGDIGLWGMGRLVRIGLLANSWLPRMHFDQSGGWLARQGGWAIWAILAARFLPGTRLPVFVAAGMLGRDSVRLLLWITLAGLIWTPLLVLAAVLLGEAVVEPVMTVLGINWPLMLVGVALVFGLARLALLLVKPLGRARLLAASARLWRWEFWPSWLFYLPLVPWLILLALRHRSLTVWTAANPGIPHGGVVGESKHAILQQLPTSSTIPSALIESGALPNRVAEVRTLVAEGGWAFPLVLKPDAGQRGAGVQLVHDLVAVDKYLQAQQGPVLVQPYHPGPCEAGVFYFRLPGEPTGHILAITDKVFPIIEGDGTHTLEELIWRHPRYRMQAATFLARHDTDRERVLAEGETLRLALAGNHCQGTLFRDGSHLFTPELEHRIDAMARQVAGFHIGRFDIRYREVNCFMAGKDLAVVELNGVTSEATNIYDPCGSILKAYSTLFRQWDLLFRIGAANRAAGHEASSILELIKAIFGYYRHRELPLLSM